MRTIANLIRRLLYKTLSIENYFTVLSKMYFLSFNLGFLKNNKTYAYPYFCEEILKKGDVCIDIGANLGYMSVPFSKYVGPKGKVYSVEPVKPVLSVLRRNTKSCKNIEILPFALGSENKLIQLGNNSINTKGFMSSGSHFVLDKGVNTDIVFDTEMKKGSEVFQALTRLDFIKCDIEGFEVIVIPEIKPLLLKFEPIVLVETKGSSRKTLLQFFNNINYNSYVLRDGVLHLTTESETIDVLFVPHSKLNQIEKFLN